MNQKLWEQRKRHALELLHQLLDIWQVKELLSRIEAIGPQANTAVLMLELSDIDLPFPYDEKKMANMMGIFADVSAPTDHSGGPGDEISKNINDWIHLVDNAEHKPPEQETKTVILREITAHKKSGERLSFRVAEQLKKLPYATSEQIAKLVDTTPGAVRNTLPWKNRKRLFQETAPTRRRRKKDGQIDAEIPIQESPQAEHYDILQMFQDYELGKSKKYPKKEDIAKKLNVREDYALELLEQAKKHFDFIANLSK
ncbi:MAG: hypothetical protein GY845_28765 [Planctomycetes bacterium]|nr:hypothetical protein [Planctomycetota bacterium]